MKKFLLIMCVCAILLTGAACKNKKDPTTPDETGEVSSTDTQSRETIDLDGDGVSDGYVIEGNAGSENGVENNGGNEANNGNEGNSDSGVVVEPETEIMEPTVLSEGGTKKDLWPSESVPKDVPEFKNYSEMYPATYTEQESSEEWYLGFDTTEKDYEAWIKQLENNGYRESDKIVGFWGNGKQILNLYTEEIDGEFSVSVDIFKSKPVEYPAEVAKVFPEFKPTDSTLYGWYVVEGEPNVLSVAYACGSNFAAELSAYKKQLTDAGFTVTDEYATKEVDGKTYTVRYGDTVDEYEDCFEFEF